MDNKNNLELIILEVLGCLDENDRETLHIIKETDENFSWKALAEYQNLAALLPSILSIEENPSFKVKKIFIKKLSVMTAGAEKMSQHEKFEVEIKKQDKVYKEPNKVLAEKKIDWGSLSVSRSTLKAVNGFEEVKPKAPSKSIISEHHDEHFVSQESNPALSEKENIFSTFEDIPKSSSTLKKYILVSAILFIISVTLGVYLYFYSKPETPEAFTEQNQIDTVVSPVEEFVYNDLQQFESVPESVITQKVEVVSEPQVKKSLLPKAPPKLPEPIEAPLIETKEVIDEPDVKVEEKISPPPPKEVVEVNEEPNYFVAVEEMPQPIGGLKAIQEKIEYPEIAIRASVEGKVFVRAFVDETGTVTNAEIVKGIGAGCDEAALDAIQKTKFTPGKQRGKPIKVQVTIPVVFKK
jgi:protein TonB